jgi:hypothetical protein
MTRAYAPTLPDRKVLAHIGRYHYLTAEQLLRLLGYSPRSRTYVSEILNRLTKEGILHRSFVAQPDENGEARQRNIGVWSATALGRTYLRDLGITPPFNKHGPSRTPLYYDHILPVNDALIACELFAKDNPDVELAQMVHEREIKRAIDRVEVILGGKRFAQPVAPDGWTDFRINGEQHPIWWEVDRDTEHIRDWMHKIAGIVEYYAKGLYQERFGTDLLTVAVVSVPRTGRKPIDRMWQLVNWTEQVLEHQGKKDWADVFRFTSLNPAQVPPDTFFSMHYWYRPFDISSQPLLGYEEAA